MQPTPHLHPSTKRRPNEAFLCLISKFLDISLMIMGFIFQSLLGPPGMVSTFYALYQGISRQPWVLGPPCRGEGEGGVRGLFQCCIKCQIHSLNQIQETPEFAFQTNLRIMQVLTCSPTPVSLVPGYGFDHLTPAVSL